MTKKVFAALTAAALLGQSALQVSAMNEDQLIDILATDSLQSEVVYTPIRPAQDNSVNDYSFDIYSGLVVLCTDPLLKEAQTFEVAGTTVSMSAPDAYKEHFLGEFHELNPEFIIPAGMNVTADDLYVLSGIPAEKADVIIPRILNDERFEVQGLFSVHYQRKAYYRENSGTELVITPADGCTIDYNALNTEEYGYTVSITENAGEHMSFLAGAPSTLEEALALCEKLEAREDIAFAWLAGTVTGDLPASDIQYITIAPLTQTAIVTGDVNQNGTVDTVDAIIALQEYNTVSVMGGDSALTFNQSRAADLDGDGSITAMDAQEILKTYNTNMQ